MKFQRIESSAVGPLRQAGARKGESISEGILSVSSQNRFSKSLLIYARHAFQARIV